MENHFKYKCHKTGYTELSDKVTVFKKYLLLKIYSSEKVVVLKKYMF